MKKISAILCIAFASISICFTGCGNDEPDAPIISGGNETAGSDNQIKINVESTRISTNGNFFTSSEKLTFKLNGIDLASSGQPATFKELTLCLDGNEIKTYSTLPIECDIDLTELKFGEHTLSGIVKGEQNGKTGETKLDLLKFYVVAKHPSVEIHPVLEYECQLDLIGPDGQKYADNGLFKYDLKEGETVYLPYSDMNDKTGSFTGILTINKDLNPTSDNEYEISDIKTFMFKDTEADAAINLDSAPQCSLLSFTCTKDNKIDFNTVTIVYSYNVEYTIDGVRLPKERNIASYKVSLKEERK